MRPVAPAPLRWGWPFYEKSTNVQAIILGFRIFELSSLCVNKEGKRQRGGNAYGCQEGPNWHENVKNQINLEKVKEPWTNVLKKYENSNYYNQILLMFQTNHLQCLLDRLDTMTMANSIEARVPFLDHELIEFINTVPYKFKIKWKSKFSKFKSLFSNNFSYSEKYDTNKYLLRKVGEKYLPKKMSEEKKLGFPLPMNEWMHDKKVKEILLDKKTLERNIFNQKKL